MAGEPGWPPPRVDPGGPNVARVYDYWLGGTHNFLADQDLGRSIAAVDPNIREFARANRAFLGRAVRFLSAAGITQFLDIGSGIPTQGNVHEVAQQANPGARVAYADIDPWRSRTARPSWRATSTPRSSRPTCAIRKQSCPIPPPGA